MCADPRSLSQLITSFFASESLGILRAPFLTFFSNTAFAPVLNASFRVPSTVRNCLLPFEVSLLLFVYLFPGNFFQYVKELLTIRF